MKKIYNVSNAIKMGTGKVRRWSRMTTFLPLLTMLVLLMVCLFGVNVEAWGGQVTRTWKAQVAVTQGVGTARVTIYKHDWTYPNQENKRTIGTNAQKSSTGSVQEASDSQTEGSKWVTDGTALLAICYRTCVYDVENIPDGYSFMGWYKSNGDQITTASTYTPWSKTKDNHTGDTYAAAKFAPVTVSSAGSASAISFNHPETKTVTLYFPVSDNADSNDDFNAPTITSNKVWTVKSWNLNTSTHKVEVVCEFEANSNVAKGSYEATVTLTAKSNESNTGTVSANVDLTPILTYNNGSVDISVSDADKTTLNVANLKTAYKGADNEAGDGAITYSLKTADDDVSLTSAGIFYAKAEGTYTIVASAAKGRYYEKTAEFTVTVGKRTPTFAWKSFEHIYASDLLSNVAQAKYADNNVSGLSYTYTSRNTTYVVVDGTDLRIPSTGFTTAETVRVVVSTAENDWYKAAKDSNNYYIEPKATPVFKVNDEELTENPVKTINLLIGETANMTFENTDESQFSYTTNNLKYISYAHNSGTHSGVITATKHGNELIQFSQTGTTTIFERTRSLHVYVLKHPVEISTTMNAGTWKVDSIYDGTLYSLSDTPEGEEPVQSAVTVSAKSDTVLRYVDGHWKAVGAGTDTLIFAMPDNDYWTGDTLKVKITVEKYDPEFTWNLPATVNYNRAFATPVTSTNTMEGCTFSYTSADPTVINWTNGALRTFEKTKSNVGVTVTQEGNYKWNSKSQKFYVNVEKLPNHVELTVNSEAVYNAIYANKQGDVAWDSSNGIRLGGSSTAILPGKPCYNYDDKYIIINFDGVPKKISFTTGVTSGAATSGINGNGFWYMEQKSETGSWSNVWTEESSSNPGNISKDLNPDTRYVKICYTGNFAGYVKNLKITERTEISSNKKNLDFGHTDAGSNATNQNVNINWYNVNPLTLSIIGGDGKYSVSPTSIASDKDLYAENVPVTVSYKHDAGGTHNATLRITDGTTTKDIPLTGTTDKVTPVITWKENLSPMSRGENVTNPATALVNLVYTSSDSTVVDIEGNTLKPLKKGNARITASYDGTASAIYNSNSSFIDVLVTNLAVQHIDWAQTFTRLKWTDDEELKAKNTPDFGLVATVSYYDPETEQEVVISDRSVSFTSGDDEIVEVLEGNILHVVGQGETTLTAHIDGITDSLYEATVVRAVNVREPSLDCETWVWDQDKEGSIRTINSVEYDLNGIEADSIFFDAWREPITVIIEYTDGDLYLAEVDENGNETAIWNAKTAKNSPTNYRMPLHRETKKVKFYTQFGAQGYHKFSGVNARVARYLELENTKNKKTHSIYFSKEDAKPGVEKTKSFTVNYSNITDQLDVKLKQGDKFSIVSDATIGTECGDKGKATVTVQFFSNDVDSYKDTLLVCNLTDTAYVYLSADVDKHQQQITWSQDTIIATTDNVTCNATTTAADAGLMVRYYVTEGEAATVDETTGALSIITDGTVKVEARCAGNSSYYDAKPVSKTFIISKVKPTITTNPTAQTMTLPNTSLENCSLSGGTASIDGSFAWDDNTINATKNNNGYKVNFTPENTNWYDTASCVVFVPVNMATQSIDWTLADTTVIYCNADISFNAQATSGLAVRYTTSDETVAYVDEQSHLNIMKGDTISVFAHQDGDEVYNAAASQERVIVIRRFQPTIMQLPTASSMKIGRLLSDASLHNDWIVELGGVAVEGSFAWVDGNSTSMNVAGTFEMPLVFRPANTNYYEPVDTTMNVVVEKYAPIISVNALTAESIEFPAVLGTSDLSGSVTATDTVQKPNVSVSGTVVWKETTKILRPGPQTGVALFVPDNGDWYTSVEVPVAITVTGGFIFNGNNNDSTWTEEGNWAGNQIPGDDDPVLVNEYVEITSEVTVGSLTITDGADVVVKEGGVLTIGNDGSENRGAYGNLRVENGGQVIFGAGEVKVNDFVLEAKLGDTDNIGMSGQLQNPATLKVNGNAYFDIALDPSGECSPGWYDFTVPFPVDVMTGITRFDNTTHEEKTIKNEVNYAIMDFSESRRLETGYGWKKYRSVLQPGQCYTMTIDDVDNVYRFKMVKDGAFNNQTTASLAYTETDNTVRGWNGLGNGTMSYINLSAADIEKVQVYSHATNSYAAVPMDTFTYVVGSAFFVQAPSTSSVLNYSHNGDMHVLRAPKREAEGVSEFTLTLTKENAANADDRFYVSASEDATDSYTIGRELTKFGTPTESKVAQIWANAYGMKLCDIEMPLVNDKADCALGLYAPKFGSYWLAIDKAPKDAALYLTYNDVVIWDLTASPYLFDLDKGTTNGYGLRMEAKKAPAVATDVEQSEFSGQSSARKVVIDNRIYIVTPEGKMYDIIGKSVKY